jgi:hypothetical protein
VHDYRARVLRAESETPVAMIVRHLCVACEAIWQVLPAFIARHLWRTWPMVAQTLTPDAPPAPAAGRRGPPVPARTARRWRARWQRSAHHIDREWGALFSFLFDFHIEASNWRAEHAMRWAVVTRKMCGGGNRTPRGAVTQYVLASVLRTACQCGLDRRAVLAALLRSSTPIISPDLQPRAGPH